MSESSGVDHGQLRRSNYFVDYALDRVPRRRRDEAWIAERLRDPSTRLILVWRSKNLFDDSPDPQSILLPATGYQLLTQQAESVILLGVTEDHAYVALGLPPEKDPSNLALPETGCFRNLRSVAALLERWEGALLAYARAMTYWHHHHRFCGSCGSPTRSAHGGHLRICTDPQCGQSHFPRTDPAIIVLVTSGERCLLGRQPTWPQGLYSIIAGFVEPGESLEEAVAREVREETGIQIERVRYHSSQPWPFPSSLMLGFNARAVSSAIRLNDGELEEARWLSREEVADKLRRGVLRLPSEVSISHRLIKGWFDAGGAGRLGDVKGSG